MFAPFSASQLHSLTDALSLDLEDAVPAPDTDRVRADPELGVDFRVARQGKEQRRGQDGATQNQGCSKGEDRHRDLACARNP